jgi:hypothetical protein
MAHDEYEVTEAPWRNTALPPMLWFIEAHAALPIVLWLVHLRWPTFVLAVAAIATLTVVRYLGFDARSAYRTGQCFLIQALTEGRIRAVPGHRLREG